jgi:ferredoxin-thioredoxin reductase catalytic subunit
MVIVQQQIDALCKKLAADAAAGGYSLNPDTIFVQELVTGLLENLARYGYQACPCRLASGSAEKDNDIVCPCDYRDADISQYGACFCALYVNQAIAAGTAQAQSIPDRRARVLKNGSVLDITAGTPLNLKYPVWRCSVCGYLCARDAAPELCPICKVKKDRFERFI